MVASTVSTKKPGNHVPSDKEFMNGIDFGKLATENAYSTQTHSRTFIKIQGHSSTFMKNKTLSNRLVQR